jgi:hypothetical protein
MLKLFASGEVLMDYRFIYLFIYLINEFIEQSTYVLYQVQRYKLDKRKTKHTSQITN